VYSGRFTHGTYRSTYPVQIRSAARGDEIKRYGCDKIEAGHFEMDL